MKELMSAENLTEAVSAIKALNEKVLLLQNDVATWKITFTVDVEQDATGLSAVVTARVGNRGVRKTLLQHELVEFSDDTATLARTLADEMLMSLLRDEAVNALLPVLKPATAKVALLANKKGFAK